MIDICPARMHSHLDFCHVAGRSGGARVRLTPRATRALATYLRCTPVASISAPLTQGAYVAWYDRITSRADLGARLTIFGELGGITSMNLHGLQKFRVSDVWPVLNRNDCTALDDRAAVAELIEAERNGRLVDRTLTLVEDAGGQRFIDGDKRAVAIYEAAVSAMPLSIVVLIPAG
jgi:hypothetical protein